MRVGRKDIVLNADDMSTIGSMEQLEVLVIFLEIGQETGILLAPKKAKEADMDKDYHIQPQGSEKRRHKVRSGCRRHEEIKDRRYFLHRNSGSKSGSKLRTSSKR